METNEEKILDFLSDDVQKNNGYCDDCISDLLKIKPRQQVNQICHNLLGMGKLSRIKSVCKSCKKQKILNFFNETNPSVITKKLNNFKKADSNLENWNYEDEWFEETNVSNKIKKYLEEHGCKILKFNYDKRQKGHDIEIIKDGIKTIIEVKGYPSTKYVSGADKGKKKPTNPKLQAKHWFSEALLSLLIAKCKDWDNTSIALGLPRFEKYEELYLKMKPFNEKTGIKYYFVNKSGTVEEK
jgi:Holliday junction resolvase-like predicted endonuclease